MRRDAIALLITLFFIMAITVSIGVGLKYLEKSSHSVKQELFLFQTSIVLDDILKILQNSQRLKEVNSAESLELFLAEVFLIPLEKDGVNILVEVSSARSKVNVNSFTTVQQIEALKNFLVLNNIQVEYADMLLDSISGIKGDMSYNTDIFTQKPYLFRDYISSQKHLAEISDSYMKRYNDSNIQNVDMNQLFYTSRDTNSSVDLNQANALTWQLLLECDEQRAINLENDIFATSLEELSLEPEELISLNKFKTSFFEPYIEVKIKIIQDNMNAIIKFEYDIQSNKGTNFVYEV